MSSKPDLSQDPRYLEFVERYAGDLAAFAHEVCGIELPHDLVQAYEAAQQPSARVSIAADIGSLYQDDSQVGLLAPVALWHFFTRHNSTTVVVLPPGHKICRRQYRILLRRVLHGPHAWLCNNLRVNDDQVYFSIYWRIRFRSAPSGSPENLVGELSQRLLWLVEAANRLERDCYGVIGGSCVFRDNGIVLLSDRNTSSTHVPAHWSTYPVERATGVQTPT